MWGHPDSVSFVRLQSSHFQMADLLLPAGKERQQQVALKSFTEKSNFGIYFRPRVTLVTLLKYDNWGYLACMKISILGSKKTWNLAERLLHSQPSSGIIRDGIYQFYYIPDKESC
jgi:hypothetical protein